MMVFAAKGGVGKSTLASNLLVAAAQDNRRTIGVDFDGQESLARWFEDRGKSALSAKLVSFDVASAALEDWEDVLNQTASFDIAIFDMPPGVDKNTSALISLMAPKMDLILIPTEPLEPSYRMVVGFMDVFRQRSIRAIFVLNKIIKGRNTVREAREALRAHGPVCPGEITMRDEVHRAFSLGIAVVEIGDTAGGGEMRAVWDFVAGEVAR